MNQQTFKDMLNVTLKPELGKRILSETITTAENKSSVPGEINLVITWDTENILESGKWAKVTPVNGESFWALVENPYFLGAYDIPSFSISAQVNANGEVEQRAKTIRFKNVTVELVKLVEEHDKINQYLHEAGLHWYRVLGKIRKQVPRSETYFKVVLAEDGKVTVTEVADKHSADDDNCYFNTGNYYITREAAQRVADEYNNIFA